MDASPPQRTIAGPATVAGFGYWSGRDVRLEFRPAPADSGIVFVRADLPGCPRVPASIDHRCETPRRTSLQRGSARVEMVEHVLAALAGLGIDNCEVWSDQPEMPGGDGSALPFVQVLEEAGIVELEAPRAGRVVQQTVRLGTPDSWIEARPVRSFGTHLRYELDYGPQSPIVRQTHEAWLSPDVFRRELAPCRTFVLREEAEWLLRQGFGTRARPRDLLVFGPHGPIENSLRFPNECARHKVLDMVGDLALAQAQWIGEFRAYRSGHRLNAELVRRLISETPLVRATRYCA